MPQFQYTAMDGNGKEKKGKIEAANEEAAASALKEQGLFPTSIKAQKSSDKKAVAPSAGGAGKKKGLMNMSLSLGPVVIKQKDLTIFTRQLAILLDAGLPLIRSLRTLEKQSKNPALKKILGETANSVEGGSTFSEALAQNPKSFNKLFLNMIRAGEAAGAMEVILNRLALFMEKAARIAGKVKSAMIYPSVVMTIAVAITSGLMLFIVPKFEKIFTELLEGQPLPGLTQFVMGISKLMETQAIPGAGVIAGVVVLYKIIGKSKKGKYALDWIKYRMPLFGPIISKSSISKFTRTLGTLMGSGVPVLNALIIVRDTAGNEVVSNAVQQVHDAVKEGEGMAGPLAATKIFPDMVISMIEVGEETGKLPEMLDKIAETYDEEVDNAVDVLTSMIEPLMIVGLAVIVGTIVIALFMPLISIIEKLGGGAS
ncbi:MAG: pilus assembly protein PilC [Lentisphaerae bacterium GWF2_44_16]|nr:MAG: pilus assembly protein PilC [Lentisphaerae bacterium GWF2_44_16]